ncbi:MAG: hypothetical protein MOGMAGMI_01744 [Candidatus Omnitrophica bacterium]|nr:hypothetical protein [Candidatus Omnitrophota bacterium]
MRRIGERMRGAMKWTAVLTAALCLSVSAAFAEISIETSVNRSRAAVGEEVVLDIIIYNAQGRVQLGEISAAPDVSNFSRSHRQEITFINGRSASKTVLSLGFVANSVGPKKLGPFTVNIGGVDYKVPAADIEVVPAGAPVPRGLGAPVLPPAQSSREISERDLFVRVTADKEEVYVNEPVSLTYTLYTRHSATFKGFEKEPTTTGFWVEEFPPDKTLKRTEQILNGSRYVVAVVRKISIFPTQAGVYTVDPGALKVIVELQTQDPLQGVFSSGLAGRRLIRTPVSTELVGKSVTADPITVRVKQLPETGKPASFTGAVGQYRIDAELEPREVEVGQPVTLKVRVSGEGNINTVQPPVPPALEVFKAYDPAYATNVNKDRLKVEGDKTAEVVLVPRQPGTQTVPPMKFSYFDPRTGSYFEIRTVALTVNVKPATGEAADAPAAPVLPSPAPSAARSAAPEATDIRYIKTARRSPLVPGPAGFEAGRTIAAATAAVLTGLLLWFVAGLRAGRSRDGRASRLRRSHAVARKRLGQAHKLLKKGQTEAYYAELYRAVHGYLADKLELTDRVVTYETVIARIADPEAERQLLGRVRGLLDELALRRFSSSKADEAEMRRTMELADETITAFERRKAS